MNWDARTLRLLAAMLSALILSGVDAASAQAPQFPPGRERRLMESYCLACHDLSHIAQGGGTEAGWDRRLRRMIRFGSMLPKNEVPALSAYLAKILPPRPVTTDDAAEPTDTDVDPSPRNVGLSRAHPAFRRVHLQSRASVP